MKKFVCDSDFGKEVEINCCFAMVSGVGFLIENNEDAFSMKNAVKVQHPNLEKILFSLVPALGGSKFSYLCDVNIVGTLLKGEDAQFQGEVVNIKKLHMIVSGLSFEVLGSK